MIIVSKPPFTLDLYVITHHALAGPRGILSVAEAAIAGGADVIQLREKDLPTAELVRLGTVLRELTRRTGRIFIVNDRVDVALAVDADGVHLGQDDMPIPIARRLLGPEKIIGGSAGNLEEARVCLEAGADYIGVGPIYRTGTKADAGAPVGPALITAIKELTGLPIVAIGGIDAQNARAPIVAGADGVAVVSAVFGAADPEAAARQLRAVVQAAKHDRQTLPS